MVRGLKTKTVKIELFFLVRVGGLCLFRRGFNRRHFLTNSDRPLYKTSDTQISYHKQVSLEKVTGKAFPLAVIPKK